MVQLKFSFTAGALIRKQIRREIERICFNRDLELDIKESKGFFDSEYLVTIRGPNEVVSALKPDIENWMKRIADE